MALKNNDINSSTSQNLISASYLHSDPHNFLNFANLNIRMNSPSIIIEKLKGLRDQALLKERIFYDDFEVAGATDFSLKYLTLGIKDKSRENLTLQQKIIYSLNRSNVRDALLSMMEDQTEDALKKFVSSSEFSTAINEIGIEASLSITSQIKSILNSKNYSGIAKKLNLDAPKGPIRSESSKYAQAFKQEISKRYNQSDSGQIELAIKVFQDNYINLTKGELPPSWVIDEIRKNLKLANKDIFTAKSSATGILLEASFIFSENNVENLLKIEKRMEGIENTKTDVTFIGPHTKKRYQIQLKNSFAETNYYSMKVSNKIRFTSFLKQMEQASVLDSVEELSYMFINTEFLKSNGLHRGESSNLKDESLKRMYNYINQLLSYAVIYYTGNSFLDKTKKTLGTGNLFFIYRGQRLIPLSFFITATINFLETFSRSSGAGGFRTSFGKTTSSSVENLVKTNSTINPVTLRANKQVAIDQLQQEGQYGYEYPDNLMNIGSSAGKEIIGSALINSTYFDLSIKQLENYLSSII